MNINYQLLDSINASIYWKDTEGTYLGCNKYMLSIAGLSTRDELIGKTDYQLPWRKQANKIQDTDSLVIENNKTYELEESPEVENGVVRTFLSSKTPFRNNRDKVIGVIGVSIDITEKKKIEALLKSTEDLLIESSTLRERFLKNIDHETRNPLQALVCSAEVLEDSWDKLSDKQRYEAIKLISTSSRRLEKMVTKTFDLSNLLKGKVSLNLKKANLTKLIDKTITSLNNGSLKQKKPQITFKCGSKDYFLVFDEEKIYQVLDNLLENAIKWTSSDKKIMVELHEAYFPNSFIKGIQCRIKDEGIKIPDNQLEFIFEPFTESSNTASPACGVGLGLPLCREIIKLHMGEIWAENNIQEGSTFNFIIPFNLDETV